MHCSEAEIVESQLYSWIKTIVKQCLASRIIGNNWGTSVDIKLLKQTFTISIISVYAWSLILVFYRSKRSHQVEKNEQMHSEEVSQTPENRACISSRIMFTCTIMLMGSASFYVWIRSKTLPAEFVLAPGTGHVIASLILFDMRRTLRTFFRMLTNPTLAGVCLSSDTRHVVFFASHTIVPWASMDEAS